MSMFTLTISCLTTSNSPWFMDLTFQIPMLFTGSDFTTITSHIHNWVLFMLWLHLFYFFWIYFLHSSPVAYWRPTNLGISSFSVISFSPFIVSWSSKAWILKWVAIPFSNRSHSVRTLHCDPSVLGLPYMAWFIFSLTWTRLSFMWSFWLVFCDCGFHSLCPPWIRIRGLWKLLDGKDWLWGKLGLVL